MNIFNQIKKEITHNYLEMYERSAFTIGFELEGHASDYNEYDEIIAFIDYFWDDNFGEMGSIKYDESISISFDELNIDELLGDEGAYSWCYNCEDGLIESDYCGYCDNTGKRKCFACNGTGEVDSQNNSDGQKLINGKFQCARCNGAGEKVCDECYGERPFKTTCPECNGEGEVFDINNLDKRKLVIEFASPIIPFNMKNVQIIFQFFERLSRQYNFIVNDSCGFHVHFGLPVNNLKELNGLLCWIIICIAYYRKTDSRVYDNIIEKFHNEDYADSEHLDSIYSFLSSDSINDMYYSDIIYELVNETYRDAKYHMLHLHGKYGTLEWRGPRGFLNQDLNNIRSFFKDELISMFDIIRKIIHMDKLVINDDLTIYKRDIMTQVIERSAKGILGYVARPKELYDKEMDDLEKNLKGEWDIDQAKKGILKQLNNLKPKPHWIFRGKKDNLKIKIIENPNYKNIPHMLDPRLFVTNGYWNDGEFLGIAEGVVIRGGLFNGKLNNSRWVINLRDNKKPIWGPNAFLNNSYSYSITIVYPNNLTGQTHISGITGITPDQFENEYLDYLLQQNKEGEVLNSIFFKSLKEFKEINERNINQTQNTGDSNETK